MKNDGNDMDVAEMHESIASIEKQGREGIVPDHRSSFLEKRDLIKMVQNAEDIQTRWNTWPKHADAMFRHDRLVCRMMHRFSLETLCTVCNAIMDTSTTPIPCTECGSNDTTSPYYC